MYSVDSLDYVWSDYPFPYPTSRYAGLFTEDLGGKFLHYKITGAGRFLLQGDLQRILHESVESWDPDAGELFPFTGSLKMFWGRLVDGEHAERHYYWVSFLAGQLIGITEISG